MSSLFSGMNPDTFINMLLIFHKIIFSFVDVLPFSFAVEVKLKSVFSYFLHIFTASTGRVEPHIKL